MSVECLNTIIASTALLLSLITAIIQIKLQLNEMRPYLSFVNPEIVILPTINNSCTINFNLHFENVGKCVLYYQVIQLDIYINGLKQAEVDEHNKGNVIGVNGKGAFFRYLPYTINQAIPNCKIIFEAIYNKIGKKKTYKINYEIEYKDGRIFYNKSFAN